MANLLDNLPGRETPAKKLQKEIEGMELKKQSLVAAVQSEVHAARRKRNDELCQAGLAGYQSHFNGVEVGDKLVTHFEAIKSLDELIAEKEAKIKDIASRYDDEIGLLKTQLGVMLSQPNRPNPASVLAGGGLDDFCTNCGHPYTPGDELFCTECGQKLDVAPRCDIPIDGDYAGAVCDIPVDGDHAGTVCENCGNPYTPGDELFCTECGQKLDAETLRENSPADDMPVGAVCENCGNPYTPGDELFCTDCGQKLE